MRRRLTRLDAPADDPFGFVVVLSRNLGVKILVLKDAPVNIRLTDFLENRFP